MITNASSTTWRCKLYGYSVRLTFYVSFGYADVNSLRETNF